MTRFGWVLVMVAVVLTQALTFWGLAQLEPVSFASRFLIIPLVVAIEGWFLWRPALTFREGSGALLMALSILSAVRKRTGLPSTIRLETTD